MLELTPFRATELASTTHAAGRWFWGGYPPVHSRRGHRARLEWLDAYVATFLERDLPAFGVRLPPARLRTLWTMLTHVHGNLLTVSDLGRSLGVSSHTVEGDLDVLEQTFMIRRLRPYFANVQKRLTKSAKLFVRDTGLLHFLAGLREPRELARGRVVGLHSKAM
jgi:predicted AAA+ superfamily ATPase